jgi:hypothetical protein
MQINMQHMNPRLFAYAKKYKFEENAEYYIHPPGVTAAVRPGVGKQNMTNTHKLRNMQNIMFCKGMLL